MINGKSVYFLSFADSRLACKKIIGKQATASGFFDYVFVYDESGLEEWFRKKYADRLILGSRGFGYWQWKSYLVRRIMDRMNEGDYLIYADGGCTINYSGKERFLEYLTIVDNHQSGILGFQQSLKESEWTKGDIFQYFGVLHDDAYRNHGQIAATTFILRKNWNSQQFIDEWYYVCNNHWDLCTDSPSVAPNDPNFQENRHDQSIFSILALKYGIAELSIEEIFSEEGYENMTQYPIWATRYKPKKHSWLWKLYHKLK